MLWGLRPVEPRAAYGLAVDLLRKQIHVGLLLPDEKLPAERLLSEHFEISRVTLREALRVLETDQYITVRRGAQGGAFVADEEKLCSMAYRRMSRAPAVTMRVVEFLTVNQLAAARYAAARRGPAELKRMREALGLMQDARSAPQRKQAEALFLLALGDASHNPLLARALEDGLSELFLPFEAPFASGAFEVFGQLFAAVDGGEAVLAEAAMGALHELLWANVRKMIRNPN